jgi:uncharacterized protein (TIGR03435 family)
MRSGLSWSCVIALVTGALVSSAATPEFEVASVRPSRPAAGGNVGAPIRIFTKVEFTADRVNITNLTLREVLAEAYQVPPSRFSEADPSYATILNQRYNIQAKSEGPASKQELILMLRALLAERFHLSLSREQIRKDVYRLVVRKGGVKLERSSAENEDAHWERRPDQKVYLRDASAGKFAEMLQVYFMKPVLPPNDLDGLYHFPLPGATATPEGQAIIIGSLRPYGLDIVKDNTEVEYLAVERVTSASEN